MNKKHEKVEKLSGFHQASWTHLCINSKEAAQGTLVIRNECSFNSILGSRHVVTESDSGRKSKRIDGDYETQQGSDGYCVISSRPLFSFLRWLGFLVVCQSVPLPYPICWVDYYTVYCTSLIIARDFDCCFLLYGDDKTALEAVVSSNAELVKVRQEVADVQNAASGKEGVEKDDTNKARRAVLRTCECMT
ncbi:hypothetical protein P8452_54481 [Trifolium repens]|nr:hypothetical protein P8452_54481 [Trifolium repens]